MCPLLKITELEIYYNEESHEDGYHISGKCDADIDEEDSHCYLTEMSLMDESIAYLDEI